MDRIHKWLKTTKTDIMMDIQLKLMMIESIEIRV